MVQILKDISANRMPSVANLLKEASQAPTVASKPAKLQNPAPSPVNRAPAATAMANKPSDEEQKKNAAVPRVVDMESSQEPIDAKGDQKAGPPKPPSQPTLKLPMTTVMGKPPKNPPPAATPPAQKVDQAVTEQKDLLAEFEKIADQLNQILANLEGSTLVKRLKAASRKQYAVSGKIGDASRQHLRRRSGSHACQAEANCSTIFPRRS